MVKVAIDAGHGLYTAGKRCSATYDKNQTREWTLNSRIVARVIELAKGYDGLTMVRTDDPTGKTDVSLSARCSKANSAKADIFVSVHHNAGGGHGIEVYRYPTNDSKTVKLQDLVYAELVAANGNKGTRSNPKRTADFQVLRQTAMPAVLIENGFMDNAVDVPLILSADYAEKSAQGIMSAIAKFFGLQKIVVAPEPEQKKETIYRVQVGAYAVRSHAEAQLNRLAGHGISGYIKTDKARGENLYRVLAGAYTVLDNAHAQVDLLRDKYHFNAYIREEEV